MLHVLQQSTRVVRWLHTCHVCGYCVRATERPVHVGGLGMVLYTNTQHVYKYVIVGAIPHSFGCVPTARWCLFSGWGSSGGFGGQISRPQTAAPVPVPAHYTAVPHATCDDGRAACTSWWIICQSKAICRLEQKGPYIPHCLRRYTRALMAGSCLISITSHIFVSHQCNISFFYCRHQQ